MLVAVGSCLLMIVSAYGFESALKMEHVVLDPSRIAAQVVSGIGFLGAGSIILRDQVVRGLTTAASIWSVAAIGLASGGGLYFAALLTTAIILAILVGVKPIEEAYCSRVQSCVLKIKSEHAAFTVDELKKLLGVRGGQIKRVTTGRVGDEFDETTVHLSGCRRTTSSSAPSGSRRRRVFTKLRCSGTVVLTRGDRDLDRPRVRTLHERHSGRSMLSAQPRSETDLAGIIDHTLLRADATRAEVLQHCREAIDYGFKAVCINPVHVALVAETLAGTPVATCSVVGFPLGATTPLDKGRETEQAVTNGATEIDMVIALGALKEGRIRDVRDDVSRVRQSCPDGLLKVIIETCLLNKDEKMRACELAIEAGADFVKTSTGFSTGGATVEDVRLMRGVVGEEVGVKASGGIRTFEAARAMVSAGASRIGASSGIAILGPLAREL